MELSEYNQEYITKSIIRAKTKRNIISIIVLSVLSVLFGMLLTNTHVISMFSNIKKMLEVGVTPKAIILTIVLLVVAALIYLFADVIAISAYSSVVYVIAYAITDSKLASAMLTVAATFFICRHMLAFFFRFEGWVSMVIWAFIAWGLILALAYAAGVEQYYTSDAVFMQNIVFSVSAGIAIFAAVMIGRLRFSKMYVSKVCEGFCMNFIKGDGDSPYPGNVESIRTGMLVGNIGLTAGAVISNYQAFVTFLFSGMHSISAVITKIVIGIIAVIIKIVVGIIVVRVTFILIQRIL